MKDQCFYHLDHFPLFTKFYLDEAKRAYYPAFEKHAYPTAIEISKDNSLTRGKFFKTLKRQFPNTTCGYQRFQPWTFHKFHTDQMDDRGFTKKCSINVVLSDHTGMTLFETGHLNPATQNILQCDYQQYRPTLFNAQIPHGIINNSDQTRYTMMIAFNDATFDTVKQYLDSVEIDSY